MSMFPTRILLTTDGSKDSELAATTAVGLANGTGSELHLVHVGPVVPVHFEPSDVEPARLQEEARRVLDEQTGKVESLGGTVAQSHLRMGGAAEEVISLSEELGAGLIVSGSRGRSRIKRLLVGSVSDSVVRHAHCPVMVVRGKPAVFPARILVATDGSEEAAMAMRGAGDLAARTGSQLALMHVGVIVPVYHPERHDYPARYERVRKEAQQLLDEQVLKIEGSGGVVERAVLAMGRADEEIIAAVEEMDADLVVIGSRGLGGVRRAVMGSVSDSVVRHAHCPVMVVRPQGAPSAAREEDFLT
jgi:nucleotide-binding universal stress UspA family protein